MKYKTAFIYGLIDPLNGEIRYIGKTINIKDRYRKHLKPTGNTYKDRWVRKLLESGLKPEILILDEVEYSEWVFWESYWIAICKSWGLRLTNTTTGGEGCEGYKHTDESRAKIAKSKLGKQAAWWIPNYVRTDEHKRNISESKKGVSISSKGKVASDIKKIHLKKLVEKNKKPVIQMDKENNIIREWSGVAEAQKSLNLRQISKCCKGELQTCGGFKWMYKLKINV